MSRGQRAQETILRLRRANSLVSGANSGIKVIPHQDSMVRERALGCGLAEIDLQISDSAFRIAKSEDFLY